VYSGYRLCNTNNNVGYALVNISGIFSDGNISGYRLSFLELKNVFVQAILPDENFLDSFSFTKREKEILFYLICGSSVDFIAKSLFVSKATVKKHLSNIYAKLNVKSKSGVFKIIREYQENKFGKDPVIFSLIDFAFPR
jgi:DNA-binding CsgD family transcriptional regulator